MQGLCNTRIKLHIFSKVANSSHTNLAIGQTVA